MASQDKVKPSDLPSLSEYFSPPDDYQGTFGVMVGYSADASFMNDALERFSLQTHMQRSVSGIGYLALMLDKHHQQISLLEAPGLIHLPIINTVTPYKLLHAKVALLQFRHPFDHELCVYRLLVSTGNWTRQTQEESLDMVWAVDFIPSPSFISSEHGKQTQADIVAAYHFLHYLISLHDSDLLALNDQKGSLSDTSLAFSDYSSRLNKITMPHKVKPRFFDNRKASLLTQLPRLITLHAKNNKRNYLAVGSGFYESATENKMPVAIEKIENSLQEHGLLTRSATKQLVVNPTACQAVATNQEAITEAGWQILPAFDNQANKQPEPRQLHAKFIFSAKRTERSNQCKHAWVYLGSGNITAPGFTNSASYHGGNLEAGVLFQVNGLDWQKENDNTPCVPDRLPIRNQADNEFFSLSLAAGSDMPEHNNLYTAAPVAYFILDENEGERCFLQAKGVTDDVYFTVVGGLTGKNNRFEFEYPQPRMIEVQWNNGDHQLSAMVPVVDEFGRIAGTSFSHIELDEAWSLLGAFPSIPDDDEMSDRETHEQGGETKTTQHHTTTYQLHHIMQFIEYIAAQQAQVEEKAWARWCNRLEQVFKQLANSQMMAAVHQSGVNPFSVLKEDVFRPHFARGNSPAATRYQLALDQIDASLKLTSLICLSGT